MGYGYDHEDYGGLLAESDFEISNVTDEEFITYQEIKTDELFEDWEE